MEKKAESNWKFIHKSNLDFGAIMNLAYNYVYVKHTMHQICKLKNII